MTKHKPAGTIVTLGVQAAVETSDGQILLIKHRYRPGWHFPGGGVEHGETVESALARELEEEAGIRMTGEPSLFGVYAHFDEFPGDHIALFRIKDWEQARTFSPNLEISERGFFHLRTIPDGTSAATRARLNEMFHNTPLSPHW